jgi:type IV pilus assembly protein PilM
MSIFGKKFQIGLEIGNEALQGASASPNSTKVKVWRVPLYPERNGREDFLETGELRSRVKRSLTDYDKYLNDTRRQVVMGVQGESLITGYLPLPKLNESELEMAVRSTVTREVPFPVDTLDIVHIPVKPLEKEKSAVFYSVWKKTMGHRLQELAAFCNLTIRRLEPTGVALTRELFRNRTLDPNLFYAIVDIGFELTQIVLVKGGYPYYLRDVPVGGRDITFAIQVGSQVSWSEAENVKKTLPLFEIIHTANPVLEDIQYEIKRSLAYCCKRFPCPNITEVFLSGGTALLKDFPEWLEEEIRTPVTVDSWQKIEVKNAEAPLYKACVGMALGQ